MQRVTGIICLVVGISLLVGSHAIVNSVGSLICAFGGTVVLLLLIGSVKRKGG